MEQPRPGATLEELHARLEKLRLEYPENLASVQEMIDRVWAQISPVLIDFQTTNESLKADKKDLETRLRVCASEYEQNAGVAMLEAQRQAAELEALFSQMTDGVVMYDLSGAAVRVNAAVIAAFGFDPTGMPPEEIARRFRVTRVDGTAWKPEDFLMYRALRGETVTDSRLKVTTAKGRVLLLSASGNPIRSGGKVTGAVVIYHDITERERREAEYRRQKILLNAIFEADPSGLAVLTGPELRFAYVNPAYRYITPDPTLDPLGKPYARVWPQKSKYGMRDRFREVLRCGQPFQETGIEHVFPDGTKRSFTLQARRMEWEQQDAVLVIMWDTTEIHRTELALRESEARLNRAQEIAHLGSWELDRVTNRLTWSDEIYRILGLQPQECGAAYEAFLDAVHPEDREAVDAADTGSLREGRDSYEIEHRVVRRSTGEVRTVHGKCEHLRDGSGKIVRSIGMLQDITERKQMMEALREADRKYRELVQYAPVGIYEIDFRTGRFTSVNDVICQITGYTREELLAMDPADLLDEEGQSAFQKRIDQFSRGENPAETVEYRIKTKEGLIIDALMNVTFRYNENNDPIEAWVIAVDITERKRAERVVRDSEKIYRGIGESIDYGVWVCAPDGRNLYASSSFLGLLGITQQQCSEFGWGDSLHPEDAERTVAAWKECVRTQGTWDIEHRYRGVDGQYHPILARGVPVRNEQGEIIYWAGINLDISRMKQSEQALRASEERLSALIEAAESLLAGSDPIDRLNKFFDKFSSRLGLEVYVQYNLSSDGTHLKLGSWAGFPEKYKKLLNRLELGQAVCGTVAQIRRPIVVNDVQASNDRKTELIRKLGVGTYACHPLMVGDRLLGTLSFGSRTLSHFEPETIELLRAFCNLVALALDRKRIEQALREGEARYRELLASIQDGFIQFDRDWRFTYINPRAAQTVDCEPHMLLGKNLWETFPAILGTDQERLYRQVMETRQPAHTEAKGFMSQRWYDFSVYPAQEGISVFLIEITQRKQAEDAIHWQNQVTQGINQTLQESLHCETDEQLGQVCLATAESLTGSEFGFVGEIGPDGLLHDLAISDPGWAACTMYDQTGHRRPPGEFPIEGLYGWVLANGKSLIANSPATHPQANGTPEGHPILTAFLGVPLTRDGKTIGMIAVGNREGGYSDLEQQALEALAPAVVESLNGVRAEQALRESEARSQAQLAETNAAFDAMSDALLIFDPQGFVLRANRAAIEAYGFDPSAGSSEASLSLLDIRTLEGKPVREEDLPSSRALGGETVVGEVYRFTGAGGQEHVILASASPVYDLAHKPNGAMAIWHDITERVEAEEHARRSAAQLEVQHRLIEQRELERLQIARDLHDGPVQELVGAIYALQGMIYDEEASNLAGGLKAISDTLQRQVAELRSYAGELRPPTLSRFGLEKAIRSHAETFREKHPGIRIRVDAVQDGTLPPEEIRLCLFRIYQEAMNNVARHSPGADVIVRFQKDQQEARLEVSDNGPGFDVPQDWLSLARQGHLGLVGMRERAEAIGGTLDIQSTLGQGTKLSVVVPLTSHTTDR